MRKTKLARPPPIAENLPPCPTDNDITREDKLNAELQVIQERRKLLEKQRKLPSAQKRQAQEKQEQEERKQAERKKAKPTAEKKVDKINNVEGGEVKVREDQPAAAGEGPAVPDGKTTPHITTFPWPEEAKQDPVDRSVDTEKLKKSKERVVKRKKANDYKGHETKNLKKIGQLRSNDQSGAKGKNNVVPKANVATHKENLHAVGTKPKLMPTGDKTALPPPAAQSNHNLEGNNHASEEPKIPNHKPAG